MKKDSRIEILRDKNLEKIKKLITEKGKYKVLSDFASFYNRRAYFKIDDLGNIKEKTYNPILLLFTFSDDVDKLSQYIFKYSYPEEKQNLRKIERNSNLTISVLRLNLIKTLQSSNLNFSKIFAKELYLRSKKDFFEVLYTFSMIGNPNNLKLLYSYALEKLFEDYGYDDNILYVAIAYLTKVRDEYSSYINSSDEVYEIEVEALNEDKKIYLNIFNEIVKKYEFKNINKFRNNLAKYFAEDFILNEDLKEVLMEKLK